MVKLSTERLVLREFTEDDAPAAHQYASDPRVVEFMPWGPNTEEQTQEFIARQLAAQQQEPRLCFDLAVILRADGRLIGGCGLHRIFATCDVRNLASANVLEKVGMRREGRLREDKCVRGQWRDSYVYGILEHEWLRSNSGLREGLT